MAIYTCYLINTDDGDVLHSHSWRSTRIAYLYRLTTTAPPSALIVGLRLLSGPILARGGPMNGKQAARMPRCNSKEKSISARLSFHPDVVPYAIARILTIATILWTLAIEITLFPCGYTYKMPNPNIKLIPNFFIGVMFWSRAMTRSGIMTIIKSMTGFAMVMNSVPPLSAMLQVPVFGS